MISIDYTPPGPTLDAFLCSDAFVRGIMGPIGGGKSVACSIEILRRAAEQKPDAQGLRRTRWVVVRNTFAELKTTTIKTFFEWVPKAAGDWREHGPPTFHIHGTKDQPIDLEVIFLALDRPDDVKKVLSLEITGAWVNEAREMPKVIIDGLTGRVGRFPKKMDGGCTWSGIIMDTNAPDTDHWWYVLAERDTSTEIGRQIIESMQQAEEELRAEGLLKPGQQLFEFFRQPGGKSPAAENKQNLKAGYYTFSSAGKSEDWIRVYVDAEYGFVRDGKPVYPEFRDSMHVRPAPFIPGLPVWIGIDFGLTPAAVFGQRKVTGAWRWFDELVSEDMGARRFGEQLNAKLRRDYPSAEIGGITGDPAGDARAQTDETTPFQVLAGVGVHARPAPSNDFTLRREAVALPLSRLIDGEPGLIVDPRCTILRKAMAGGYAYRRVQITGAERYQDKPDKNRFSHVAEAGQYLMLGAGEGRAVTRRSITLNAPARGEGYDPLGDEAIGRPVLSGETRIETRDPFEVM